MQEKIKQQIKQQLGENKQISDKTIDAFAKTYAEMFTEFKVTEEDFLGSNFFKNAMSTLLSGDIQSNINAIAAQAAKDAGAKAVEEYKKLHTSQTTHQTSPNDESVKRIEELERKIKEQEERQNREVKTAENKAAIRTAMKKANISDDFMEEYMKNITVNEASNVDEIAKNASDFYAKMQSQRTPIQPTPELSQSELADKYKAAHEKIIKQQ